MNENNNILHELSPEDVKSHLDQQKCLLIDVREPGEFEAERIPDALLFPLSGFNPNALPLQGDRRIILQCGTGKRSGMAAALIHNSGIRDVAHLTGGLKAWKEAGLPFIKFDPSSGKSTLASQ